MLSECCKEVNKVEIYDLLKANAGEDMDNFFERMVERSKDTHADVFGLFNGVLYVIFYGLDCPEKY